MTPPADLLRRIRVLRARQRIEDLALQLLCHVEGAAAEGRSHGNVKTRLLLLLHGTDADGWAHRYRLAERAKAVYQGTSGVLHTRSTYIDVPEAMLYEWESVVDEVEKAADALARRR